MQEGTEKQAGTRAVPRIDSLEHTYVPYGTAWNSDIDFTCWCTLALTINSYPPLHWPFFNL